MRDDFCAIKIVEQMLFQAFDTSASDIHLELAARGLRVRFRIYGLLYDKDLIALEFSQQVIARVKVLSDMNLAERRVPQDGKFFFIYKNSKIDLRVSTFPGVTGEKVVIRLLDQSKSQLDISSLGFEKDILKKIKKIANSSSGFFLVSGPTGSGKTTTLHSMLKLVNTSDKNISTLEDPVEYHIDGITQGHINSDVGFTFEIGIRALLRQDPDIIMVGEIRDKETANVAIQASLTGHFVLSTLHTNNAISSLMRLIDMKIEPFLLNSALTGILSQRLVRRLCDNCKFPVALNLQEIELVKSLNINIDKSYSSSGCSECFNLGFKNRIGLFELLVISENLKSIIKRRPIFQDIYKQACLDGMKTLFEDAANKINLGMTSFEEAIRVLL